MLFSKKTIWIIVELRLTNVLYFKKRNVLLQIFLFLRQNIISTQVVGLRLITLFIKTLNNKNCYLWIILGKENFRPTLEAFKGFVFCSCYFFFVLTSNNFAVVISCARHKYKTVSLYSWHGCFQFFQSGFNVHVHRSNR